MMKRFVSTVLLASMLAPSVASSVALFAPGVAFAQAKELTKAEVEAARTAFKEGLAAEKEGDFVKALARFEATAAIKTTPQVRFHLAVCQEKLGRWVEALANYELSNTEAKEKKITEVTDMAPTLADRLRPRIPRLVLETPGKSPDEVQVDGVVIAKEKWTAPIMVDPGKHVLVARFAGEKNFVVELDVVESEEKKVAVGNRPVVLPEEDKTPLPPPGPPPAARSTGMSQRTIGFIVGGFGVVALGTSAIFYGLRTSKVSELDEQCPDLKCPSSASSKVDSAKTDTTISRVALGVGIVSLGVGAYLVLTAKPAPAEGQPAPVAGVPRFVPYVPNAPNALAGFGFEGAF
jgi:hypothetical protein